MVGVITDSSRLCINGLSIQTDADTILSIDGRIAPLRALADGQIATVSVTAIKGALRANRLVVSHELIGPVTDIESAGAELSVMGQRIVLRPSALRAPGMATLAGLKLGDVVRVSGMRNGRGEIDGTRIDVAPRAETAMIVGRYSVDSNRPPFLAGIRLRFFDRAPADAEVHEKTVRMSGRWTGAELVVEQVAIEPVASLLGRAECALLQGYSSNSKAGILLAGLVVRFGPGTRFDNGDRRKLRTDLEVTATGPIRADGQLEVERLVLGELRPVAARGVIVPRAMQAAR